MIKLPKSLIALTNRIAVSPSHVSNGHWAVPRTLLAQPALFTSIDVIRAQYPKATVTELEQSAMDQVLRGVRPAVCYHRTPVLWEKGSGYDDALLYLSPAEGYAAWVARPYADRFDVSVLHGAAPSASRGSGEPPWVSDPLCTDRDPMQGITIMPCRPPKDTERITSAMSAAMMAGASK